MTLFIIFLSVLVGTILGTAIFTDIHLPRQYKDRITNRTKADQSKIEELEAEIFGVDNNIRDLPGCRWKITDSDLYFYIVLKNEKQKTEEDTIVYKTKRYCGGGYRQVPREINLTESELDADIQEAMKTMVKKAINGRVAKEAHKRLMDKYNNKSVVQNES